MVSVLIVLRMMGDRDFWRAEGLGGDARCEDAGQALGLASGVQKKGFCWNLMRIFLC